MISSLSIPTYIVNRHWQNTSRQGDIFTQYRFA